MDSIGFEPHDHSSCIQDCIAAVDAHCRAEGLQFTPVRRRVLEILLQEHRALGPMKFSTACAKRASARSRRWPTAPWISW